MSRRFRELLHRLAFRDYINAFIENYNGFATSNCNTVEAWDKQAVYKRRGLRGNSACNAPFRIVFFLFFNFLWAFYEINKRPNISETPTPHRLSSPQPARSLNQPTSSRIGSFSLNSNLSLDIAVKSIPFYCISFILIKVPLFYHRMRSWDRMTEPHRD